MKARDKIIEQGSTLKQKIKKNKTAKFYLQWHITNRCGNNCKHCYITDKERKGPEPDMKTTEHLMNDLKEISDVLGCGLDVSITGGDPFLHSQFWEILKKTRETVDFLAVMGNPELINDSLVAKMIDIGVDRYCLSLDGFRKTHDYIRYKGSFDKTIKAIKLLVDSPIKVGIQTTVSSLNINETVGLMNYVYGLGVTRWAFSRYVPKNNEEFDVTAEQHYDLMCRIKQEHKKWEESLGIPRQVKDPLWATVYDDYPAYCGTVQGGCVIGSMALTLLPDNMVRGCRRHEGSILERWGKGRSLLEIWLTNDRLDEMRQFHKIEVCSQCKYLCVCRGCRAVAWAKYKSLYAEDPHCIIAAKLKAAERR